MISLIRVAGWLAVLTIVALSVMPGQMRPDVLGEKHVEHVAAYFGTAMLLAIGYPRRSQLVLIGALLPACAGLLEIIQLGINGRTASIADFATSVLGAWIGVMVGCFFGMTRRAIMFVNLPLKSSLEVTLRGFRLPRRRLRANVALRSAIERNQQPVCPTNNLNRRVGQPNNPKDSLAIY
jgi:hypothetical protein